MQRESEEELNERLEAQEEEEEEEEEEEKESELAESDEENLSELEETAEEDTNEEEQSLTQSVSRSHSRLPEAMLPIAHPHGENDSPSHSPLAQAALPHPLANIQISPPRSTQQFHGIWISGKSGIGKTTLAKQLTSTHRTYSKSAVIPSFPDYRGQLAIVIEDLLPLHGHLSNILQLQSLAEGSPVWIDVNGKYIRS
jgi:ATPase subunit of ABC transporter with duplicated ATPase domains